MQAALDLKEPDRVPFTGLGGDVIPAYAGITSYEYEFDFEKNRQAAVKWFTDFPSDSAPRVGLGGLDNQSMGVAFQDYPEIVSGVNSVNGPMNDILKMKFVRFPGRELDENSARQFIGGKNMEPEEYDQLIADPVKFCFEVIMPRISGGLKDLGSPASLATMARFGLEKARQDAEMAKTMQALMELGYYFAPRGVCLAPLDLISDQLRDIPNLILDLRRYPDKVKAAAEALVEPMVKMGTMSIKAGAKECFIPLHLNEYLSPKQYNEFYWPTLKEVILKLVEAGMKVQVFFEGWHDAHLETILELPAGWGTAYFEKTDVRKAKKLLQGHTCIMGGIDVSDIISLTPAQLDENIKKLFDEMAPGGGFIFSPNIGTCPRETPIENVRAVYEAVEKYGKY
jgi:hypothetical protein